MRDESILTRMKNPLLHGKKMKRRKLVSTLICGVVGAVTVIAGGYFADFFGAVFALMFSNWLVVYAFRVRKKDYTGLPHAVDTGGVHRCIFCGNRGIYRQGQYKTNNTHSNCSKCQKHLFTE